jgi:YVTN family beta-propeller protein
VFRHERTHQYGLWVRLVVTGVAFPMLLLVPALFPTAQTAASTAAAAQAASAAPKAYIGLFKDNAVAVLDTRTNTVVKTIPVPPGPHGLVLTPDGRKAYVSSDAASTVSVIDTATDQIVRNIEVGPTPHGLAISPDGRQVVVSSFGTNRAIIIDTASDQIAGQVPVPQAHNSAIRPDGRVVYVGSQRQGVTALVEIDLVKRTRIGTVPLDKAPRALNFSPNGKWLYFTVAGEDAVRVLDPASNRIVAHIQVGASPHHPLFTPNGRLGLVVSQGPGELELLDPADNTLSGTIAVGKAPHWIAISSDGQRAYVTNEASNTVSVVDLVGHGVIATVPVGNAPRKIAIQPGAPAAFHGRDVRPAPLAASASWAALDQTITVGGRTFADHGTVAVKEGAILNVEVDDYYFEPTFLRGKPGQKITLEIDNNSSALHNISVPQQKVDKDILPKGKVKVEVTFPQSGALRFFCKFHTALGMNGGLLVGDATPQSVTGLSRLVH